LSPPENGGANWNYTVLHHFTAATGEKGANPAAAVFRDNTGTLYGTTLNGGQDNGNVFQLAKPKAGGSSWRLSSLHDFSPTNHADGYGPVNGLVMDDAGILYGEAEYGIVFNLAPPAVGKTAWTETVLYTFPDADGYYFGGGNLAIDAAGALYGTTSPGSSGNYGVVFKLTP
jgi:hypothetical protein